MKKSLIALAVLATAGVASAQSSVTLFGVVDATLAFGKGSGVGSSSKTQLTNSGYNGSRLGFRGTEDLGGGMSASFWLEAGVANDDGAGVATNTNNQATGGAIAGIGGGQGLTFNRRSTVSLAGGWGELRLGRDYSPQFWNLTVFDPYGTNGVGTTQTLKSSLGGPVTVRASNAIGYFLQDAALWLMKLSGHEGGLAQFQCWYGKYGVWVILIKGLTPIPYKILTIAAGVSHVDLSIFIVASIIARALRFYVVAALLYWFGPPIRDFIEKRLTLVTTSFAGAIVLGFVALHYL